MTAKIFPVDQANDTLSVQDFLDASFQLISRPAESHIHVLAEEVVEELVGDLGRGCVSHDLIPEFRQLHVGILDVVGSPAEVAQIVCGGGPGSLGESRSRCNYHLNLEHLSTVLFNFELLISSQIIPFLK